MKTPLYLGLSTHRRIHPVALPKIEEAAKAVLAEAVKIAADRDSYLVMLNSLAEGGDTLLARLAIKMKIPIIAILPRVLTSYAEDFESDAKMELFSLTAKSENLFVTPDIEKRGRSDYDYFYRQAGIYVAAKSDIFVALWDGVAGKPDGCGAAEAYDFAKNASYADPEHAYPLKARTLYHILAPRPTQDPTRAGEIRKETVTP